MVARRAYYGSVDMLREIESPLARHALPTGEHIGPLRLLTSTILEQVVRAPGLALRLAGIKSYDEYTLYHSVNVAVICTALAIRMGRPMPPDPSALAVTAAIRVLARYPVIDRVVLRDHAADRTFTREQIEDLLRPEGFAALDSPEGWPDILARTIERLAAGAGRADPVA